MIDLFNGNVLCDDVDQVDYDFLKSIFYKSFF